MKIRRHRLVFRSESTGKKFAVVRLTSEELSVLQMAALAQNMTIMQFIINAITQNTRIDE